MTTVKQFDYKTKKFLPPLVVSLFELLKKKHMRFIWNEEYNFFY